MTSLLGHHRMYKFAERPDLKQTRLKRAVLWLTQGAGGCSFTGDRTGRSVRRSTPCQLPVCYDLRFDLGLRRCSHGFLVAVVVSEC